MTADQRAIRAAAEPPRSAAPEPGTGTRRWVASLFTRFEDIVYLLTALIVALVVSLAVFRRCPPKVAERA